LLLSFNHEVLLLLKVERDKLMGKAKIEVKATYLGDLPGLPPHHHLFIVYTDSEGRQFRLEGGPTGGSSVSSALSGELSSRSSGSSRSTSRPFGNIGTVVNRYGPAYPAFDAGAKSTVIYTSSNPTQVYQAFQQLKAQVAYIGATGIRYDPLQQNSNAVVGSAIRNVFGNVNLSKILPDTNGKDVWAPGAEIQLIDRQGRLLRSSLEDSASQEMAGAANFDDSRFTTPAYDSTLTSLQKLNQAIAQLQSPTSSFQQTQQPASSSGVSEAVAQLNQAIAGLNQPQPIPQSLEPVQPSAPQKQREQMELA
jgi:hypothetical protein